MSCRACLDQAAVVQQELGAPVVVRVLASHLRGRQAQNRLKRWELGQEIPLREQRVAAIHQGHLIAEAGRGEKA